MAEFNHLLFIVGVIVGLGIARILAGVEEIIQHRKRIQIYWVLLLWMLILFILQVQTWYVHYTYDTETIGADFFSYITSLVFPILPYVASCLIAPKISDDSRFSLRDYYYTHHRWFFGISFFGVAYAAIHSPIATGNGFSVSEILFDLGALVPIAILMTTKNAKIHGALTIAVAALIVAFLAVAVKDLK